MVFFMNKMDIFDSIIEIIAKEADNNGKLLVNNSQVLKEFFINNNAQTGQNINQKKQPINSPNNNHNQNYQNKNTQFTKTSPNQKYQTNTQKSSSLQQLAKYDLATLKNISDSCTLCNLAKNRNLGVFGAGNPQADLMFIGEVPTANDNLSGTPFNNVDGELLAKMITAMQFSCDEIFITHTVKCHTENERQPYPNEAQKCLPYLERQIELIQPKIIVLLGGVPLRYLLKLNDVNNYRGQWQNYNGIKVMPTFSPSYLNRYPNEKGKTWNDLKQVMQFFGKK